MKFTKTITTKIYMQFTINSWKQYETYKNIYNQDICNAISYSPLTVIKHMKKNDFNQDICNIQQSFIQQSFESFSIDSNKTYEIYKNDYNQDICNVITHY